MLVVYPRLRVARVRTRGHTCFVIQAAASRVVSALDLFAATGGAIEDVTGARPIDLADSETLCAVERYARSGAASDRRAEFASGRALLRRLIDCHVPIPMMSDRRPLRPPGIRASVAHYEQFVVAVASRVNDLVSLSVDINSYRRFEPGVMSIIGRVDELGIDPLVVFCVKEAVYEAYSQSGGGFLQHGDVRVALDGLTFVAEVLEYGVVLQGGRGLNDGRCVALAVLRPGAVAERAHTSPVAEAFTPDQVGRVDRR